MKDVRKRGDLKRMADIALLLGCLLPATMCAITDLKTHLIYNKVTLPMLAAGLIYAAFAGRLQDALLGMALGFGVIFVCVLMGGAGGGDAKLAAALGAWMGTREVVWVLLIGAAVGVIWGSCKLFRQGELKKRFALFFKGIFYRCVWGMKGTLILPKLPEELDAPVPRDAIPFGACLALAAWVVWGMMRLSLT